MFHFVSKKEVQSYRSECSLRLQKLITFISDKFAVKSQLVLFGSGSTGLFTRNGNSHFDLDYNIEIISSPENLDLKKLKDSSMAELNRLFAEKYWSGARDSTSTITLLRKDNEGRVVFKLDIAFIKRNSQGDASRLIHDKTNGTYFWNVIPQYKNIKERTKLLKDNGYWPQVRDTYLAKKNMYLTRHDTNHFSFKISVETINEVYQKMISGSGKTVPDAEKKPEPALLTGPVFEKSVSSLPVTFYVDFETVASEGLQGLKDLRRKDRIVLFYSEKASNLKIETVQELLKHNISISFEKVTFEAPNASGLELVVMLSRHLGQGRNYCIISKDTGMDAAVARMNRFGLGTVTRCSCLKDYYSGPAYV